MPVGRSGEQVSKGGLEENKISSNTYSLNDFFRVRHSSLVYMYFWMAKLSMRDVQGRDDTNK